MKKFVFAAIAALVFVACNDAKNAEKAETFQHNVDPANLEQFHDQWNGDGINGTQVVIACDNHFVYTPSDLHWEGEYRSFCFYRLNNVTPQTAGTLNGCYTVDNGELVSESDGSRPGITVSHEGDTIYSARVSNPQNIRADFAPYLTTCHADIFKLCFDTVAHRVVAYFKDHHNYEGTVEGDWWGGRIRDTAWMTIRDTLVIIQHDTIHHYVVDTVITNGDTTVYTYFIVRRHKSWDGSVSGGFIYGTDSVRLVKMDANGAIVDTWRGTYRHRTAVNYNVPSVMPAAVENNCYTFNGANANCAGTTATCTLGNTQVVGPVVLNGMDITNYLTGCQPYVQRICFGNLTNNNGPWTIFILGPEGDNAATITGNYHTNSNPPADTTTQVVLTHTSSNPNGSANGLTGILYQETNTKTTIYYVNGTEVRRSSVNFGGRAPYQYVESGTFTAAMTNVTVPFVGNTATLVGGYSLTVTPGAMYTVPSGFMAELQQLGCAHQHDSLVTSQTGLTLYGHWSCPGHSDVVTTYFIPKNPVTPPTQFNPTPLSGASDSYEDQIFDQIGQRHTFLIIYEPMTSGSYKRLKFDITSRPTNIVRSQGDSTVISASDYNNLVSTCTSNNAVPAVVIDHTNGTTQYDGSVQSDLLSSGNWRQIYRRINGSTSYIMSTSASTIGNLSGRNADRGRYDASLHRVEVNWGDGTSTIYPL